MGLLDDKVVLVSGGTQDVGGGVARAAVAAGARVVVTGRREDVGHRFAAELAAGEGLATYVHCDVSGVAQIEAAVAAAIDAYGRIDCLVNSAGLTSRGTLLDTSPNLFDAHIAVNLRGPRGSGAEAVPRCRRRLAGTSGGVDADGPTRQAR